MHVHYYNPMSRETKHSILLHDAAACGADQQNTVLQDQDGLHSCVDRQFPWVHMEWTCATDVHDILYTGMQRICCLLTVGIVRCTQISCALCHAVCNGARVVPLSSEGTARVCDNS